MDEVTVPPQLSPKATDTVGPSQKPPRHFPLVPFLVFVFIVIVLGILIFYNNINATPKIIGEPPVIKETPVSSSASFSNFLKNSGKVETINPQPIVTTPVALPKSENSFYQQLGKNLKNLFP